MLEQWQRQSGNSVELLEHLLASKEQVPEARQRLNDLDQQTAQWQKSLSDATAAAEAARSKLDLAPDSPLPDREALASAMAATKVAENTARERYAAAERAKHDFDHWAVMNRRFGGDRFRTLVQSHILLPLLNNANIYLSKMSDRYLLTCSDDNEQLSILVQDRYNNDEIRSVAVLSGGERFMVSLALSLALSSLNRPDMNVNILFIDEGFGTLDQECLDSVVRTLNRLCDMPGQNGRRVGIISHREELLSCIPNKIKLTRAGEGRSRVEIVCEN